MSIRDLAELVISQLGSSSQIEQVSYESVYGEGFEDMQRRVPSIAKANALIGWSPEKDLASILDDVVKESNRGG